MIESSIECTKEWEFSSLLHLLLKKQMKNIKNKMDGDLFNA